MVLSLQPTFILGLQGASMVTLGLIKGTAEALATTEGWSQAISQIFASDCPL